METFHIDKSLQVMLYGRRVNNDTPDVSFETFDWAISFLK